MSRLLSRPMRAVNRTLDFGVTSLMDDGDNSAVERAADLERLAGADLRACEQAAIFTEGRVRRVRRGMLLGCIDGSKPCRCRHERILRAWIVPTSLTHRS